MPLLLVVDEAVLAHPTSEVRGRDVRGRGELAHRQPALHGNFREPVAGGPLGGLGRDAGVTVLVVVADEVRELLGRGLNPILSHADTLGRRVVSSRGTGGLSRR